MIKKKTLVNDVGFDGLKKIDLNEQNSLLNPKKNINEQNKFWPCHLEEKIVGKKHLHLFIFVLRNK